ncbi:hypothetical protein [Nocardia sp. NPDC050413]|uniref:hypothetical protein n=1 Tax=Nocardia sp. NPDC050413 TaxID=3155784 RepID=UPI0033EB8AF4
MQVRPVADGQARCIGCSSKLIHGGLRYLEQMGFTLVREALEERGLLLNSLEPHLVLPVAETLSETEGLHHPHTAEL